MTNTYDNGSSTSPADDQAIRDVVAAAERHQNELDAFIALHADDAIIVNIAGRRVLGRETIRAAMASALESPLAKVLTRTQIDDIRFVRPDVAIVSCTKHVSDERDVPQDESERGRIPSTGSLSYVVVREQDAWQIALAQTTPIS